MTSVLHPQSVKHSQGGNVLVAVSSLTGRYWGGGARIYSAHHSSTSEQTDTTTGQLMDSQTNGVSTNAMSDEISDLELVERSAIRDGRMIVDAGVSCQVSKLPISVQSMSGVTDCVWLGEMNFVTAEDNGAVKLWLGTMEGEPIYTQDAVLTHHHNMVLAVDTSSDQSMIISSSADSSVRLCQPASPNRLMRSMRGHTGPVNSVKCHPTDVNLFLSACSTEDHVLLWDLRKEKPAQIIDVSSVLTAGCSAVAWQPGTDLRVALGGTCGEVVLKDMRSDTTRATQRHVPHTARVTALAFSPHRSSLLASASQDCTVTFTNHGDLSLDVRHIDRKFKDYVSGVSWSPTVDGMYVTCSWDGRTRTSWAKELLY